jgi:hypothetical protein
VIPSGSFLGGITDACHPAAIIPKVRAADSSVRVPNHATVRLAAFDTSPIKYDDTPEIEEDYVLPSSASHRDEPHHREIAKRTPALVGTV